MSKSKIIALIAGAAVTAGLTEAAGLFPAIKEILAAGTLLVSAIVTFIVAKAEVER